VSKIKPPEPIYFNEGYENVVLSTEAPVFAVGDIELFRRNGWSAKLNMQLDITSVEVGCLMVLMVTAIATSFNEYDYASYISENNLERHFIIKQALENDDAE